ncbi:MAG: AI-2E family transporter [Bacteroidetes bacterium SB0662_bin_6]|nr:AI-2E family transporter [Bacteroidetes bacterium SB0668_bin_1]MYE04517.1 AI-2E family transporter [Bacteroidetes bacterium SB0662_bin_6]
MPDESPKLLPVPDQRLTPFRTALLVGGVLLFLGMIYQMGEDFIGPPLVAFAGAVLLWPLRKIRAVRVLLVAGAVMLFLWALNDLAIILMPFAVVYLFAYLFDPLVTMLHDRFGIRRAFSSLAVTAALIGVFASFIFLVVPTLLTQFEELFLRLMDTMDDFRAWLQSATLLDNLEEVGVDRDQIVRDLTSFLQEQATNLATRIPTLLQSVLTQIGTVLGAVALVAVLPVVHYYLLKDFPPIKRRIVELFPTLGGRRDYLFRTGEVVGNYLRGQLIICAIAGFNVSVVLTLLDVPFALVIGILGGILNLIPNIGIIVTNIIGIGIGLFLGDPWYVDVLKIVAVLMGQSILESTVLVPNIMSKQMGLHPVLIILSLFIFAHFMGWVGLIIAVPVTALIMAAYKTYRDHIRFELRDEEVDVMP